MHIVIKIIISDKNVVVGGGECVGVVPLPNIIPNKSPSPADPLSPPPTPVVAPPPYDMLMLLSLH